ncbi:MAG: ATP-binding protein [Amaricoccus sp.]|uniref:ATP-binding protein n=1 Tax=Amaricoccus sp. TaxID=1872485 RepID=UPI0039E56D1A
MTIPTTRRAVMVSSHDQFGELLAQVLSPSRPLQSEELLRGRQHQMADLRKAFYQPGRHVLIHGLRGVGKTSLAQTAAFSLASHSDPILVGCEEGSTLFSVIREIFEFSEQRNPKIRERVREISGGFSRFGVNAAGTVQQTEGPVAEPGSTNDAVRLASHLCDIYDRDPIIVIDEFDLIKDESEQKRFVGFVKQISDRHIPIKFIFCGIGESPESIMAAHASAGRIFHTVGLGQLPWEAREEILGEAADRVGITVDRSTSLRIARISDGFPHYVHFLAEKLFWRVFEDREANGVAGHFHFQNAMNDASEAMDIELKGPYQKAIQKYNDDYEGVLWAVADGHELVRRSTDVFENYERIMRSIDREPLDRKKFNQRINSLKSPAHASILKGSRSGWYEFTEKMIWGYVRLRAERAGVSLDRDHPAAQSKSYTSYGK